MTVVLLERTRPSLRGQLTRWMLEVHAGVFVGTLSARVRDELWTLIEKRVGKGSAMMVQTAQNEQGFSIRTLGTGSRTLFDIDGLTLVGRPPKAG